MEGKYSKGSGGGGSEFTVGSALTGMETISTSFPGSLSLSMMIPQAALSLMGAKRLSASNWMCFSWEGTTRVGFSSLLLSSGTASFAAGSFVRPLAWPGEPHRQERVVVRICLNPHPLFLTAHDVSSCSS